MKKHVDREVLAAASFYQKKYFINPKFINLPKDVQKELHLWVTTVAENIHGIFIIAFDQDGFLLFETMGEKNDFDYDHIGAGLEVTRLKREQRELVEALQLWYSVYYSGV